MKPNQTISSIESPGGWAPARSSWPLLGVQGLRRSGHGPLLLVNVTGPAARQRWTSSGPRPASPAAACCWVRLLSLFAPVVRGQNALESGRLFPRCWKGGGKRAWVPTDRPDLAASGMVKAARGSGVGWPLLWGSFSSFLCQGRFLHELPGEETQSFLLPCGALSSLSPNPPPSADSSAPELSGQGSKVRPSLGPDFLFAWAGVSAGVAQACHSRWTPISRENRRISQSLTFTSQLSSLIMWGLDGGGAV